MREINVEELKKIQIDMLVYIDQFCQHNNIRYSLSSGTLIGAIRHKGYIPWDDDIDIMMPRADYNRFIKRFNGTFEHLSLLAPELNFNYYAPYANVFDNRTLLLEGNNGHRGFCIGVKIDVFPIDSVSMCVDEYKNDMRKVEKLNSIMYVKRLENIFDLNRNIKENIKNFSKKLLYFCCPYSYLQRRILGVAVNDCYKDSEYVDNVVFNIYSKKCTRFHKSIMDEYIRVPFEDYEFSAVKGYDDVLGKMYGDYMQLPPEDKRIPHHDFKAFWLD